MSFYGVVTQCLERIEALEKRLKELETKTATDLSQEVISKTETNEEQDCLWVARDKRGGRLYVYIEKPEEQYCETFTSTDEDEIYLRIDEKLFPQVTFENSPQKLVLESTISKTETVEKDVLDKLRALLNEAEKDNREKYPDESIMTSILQRMREVIE